MTQRSMRGDEHLAYTLLWRCGALYISISFPFPPFTRLLPSPAKWRLSAPVGDMRLTECPSSSAYATVTVIVYVTHRQLLSIDQV